MNSKKIVLVTGANGFIGTYVCNYLAPFYKTVYALVHKKESSTNFISNNIVPLYWSLGKQNTENFPISEETTFDEIVHLAANINLNADQDELYSDNFLGTKDLLEIARKHRTKRLVMLSSIGVYNCYQHKIIDESSDIKFLTYYHYTKYLAELTFIQHLKNLENVSGIIFRLSSPIGVGMRENSFIPTVIRSALHNQDIVLYGKGQRIQNYIDVRDVVRAISISLDTKQNGIFNLVNPISYSNAQIANMCISIFNSRSNIVFKNEDVHEKECWLFDTDKIKKSLNFVCEYEIRQSLEWISNQYENSNMQ